MAARPIALFKIEIARKVCGVCWASYVLALTGTVRFVGQRHNPSGVASLYGDATI